MRTFIKTLGLAAALMVAIFAVQARAQDNTNNTSPPDDSSVSFQTFYDQLAGQGTWFNTDQYGYVWQPTETDPNCRPYTYGHWVNTDDGMTWVSDESFGWATYHYGRWANIDGTGWVWVPGYTWAPAWVSWRTGDEDVGWAPLPPDSDQGIDYYGDDDYYTGTGFGFHIGDDCDIAYGIGAGWYNFCPIAFIGDRDCWRHFRNYHDNYGFIGRTRNVTNINFRRDSGGRFGHVHANGPSVAGLNARAHTPIEHAQLASVSRAGEAGLHGNRLGVYAPRVDPATFRSARPSSVSGTLTDARLNRGTDINRPLATNARTTPVGATSEQIRAASLAQSHAPNSARIATTNTQIGRPLTQPLGALHTTTRSASTAATGFHSNAVGGPSRVNAPTAAAGESRYTGQFSRPTYSSNRESRVGGGVSTINSGYTGEHFGPQAVAPSRTTPGLGRSESAFPGQAYHPSSAFNGSAPTYRSSAPAFAPQRSFNMGSSAFHQSAPAFHQSAPAFHSAPSFSQPSFRSAAPAAHYGGGGFGGGAAHVSGGGGGGAHFGGGGGGGGHAGGGGHR